MKETGEPDRVGEVLHQAGATATAVQSDDGLYWEVIDRVSGHAVSTAALSHTGHWEPEHRWETPR